MKSDLQLNENSNVNWAFPSLDGQSINLAVSNNRGLLEEIKKTKEYQQAMCQIQVLQHEWEEKNITLDKQITLLNQVCEKITEYEASLTDKIIDHLDMIIKKIAKKTIGMQLESNHALLKQVVIQLKEMVGKESDVCIYVSKNDWNILSQQTHALPIQMDEKLPNGRILVNSKESVVTFDLESRINSIMDGNQHDK